VAKTVNAEKSMVKRFALVSLDILEARLLVGQNVPLTQIVHKMKLAAIKNVETRVLELVESTQNVLLSITIRFAAVRQDLLAIRLFGANK
jgi:hypothetical protein